MIAFVLSGGASLGAVQVGMVGALYERGIVPDLLVGTSAGALNAAYLADRPTDGATVEDLAAIWRSLRRADVFPTRPLGAALALSGRRDHLVSDRGLRALAEEHLGSRRLQDTAIPLHVIAADAVSGEEVRLSRGPALEAVLASTAIPGVLPPVDWGGRPLFDGGVANNAPISTAIALGATTVYVLPCGHACALPAPPRSALAMALHAITLLVHRRLIDDVNTYRDVVRLVVVPPPCPLAVSPADFSQAATLVARAAADTRRFLDEGGARRPPVRMTMHAHRPDPVLPPGARAAAPTRTETP